MTEGKDGIKDSMPSQSSATSLRYAIFKDDIYQGILDGRDAKVSFDDFPYYLRYKIYMKTFFILLTGDSN